jgi:hypothetical protein
MIAQRSIHETDLDLPMLIVEMVAEAEGIDPTAVSPPLYEVTNVSALERALFDHDDGAERSVVGYLSFRYRGFQVIVDADGSVRVTDPREGEVA